MAFKPPSPGPPPMPVFERGDYVTVAASQTGAVLGTSANAAQGNFLTGVLVVPATTSPGSVAIIDGSTSITIFAGGATSVADLKPFYVPVGAFSQTGKWSVTTGANVSIVAIGLFT